MFQVLSKERWEERLEIREDLEDERLDVLEAKRELTEEQQDVENLEKKLD